MLCSSSTLYRLISQTSIECRFNLYREVDVENQVDLTVFFFHCCCFGKRCMLSFIHVVVLVSEEITH